MKIALPQALSTYMYGHFWEMFFSLLDIQVIKSGPTDRAILKQGIRIMPAESCLPLKCYAGHVLELMSGDADFIFIPRIVCVQKKPEIKLGCPKFIGLPDLFKAACPGCSILSFDHDLRREQLYRSFERLAPVLGCSGKQIRQAFREAAQNTPMQQIRHSKKSQNGPLIALVGHDYLLKDDFLNMHIKDKLKTLGCALWSGLSLPDVGNRAGITFSAPVSWYFEQKIINEVAEAVQDPRIDGIIYLVSFGCGAGSITGEIIEHEILSFLKKPFLRLVIDEHTGEAGVTTRLESFIDMIGEQKR